MVNDEKAKRAQTERQLIEQQKHNDNLRAENKRLQGKIDELNAHLNEVFTAEHSNCDAGCEKVCWRMKTSCQKLLFLRASLYFKTQCSFSLKCRFT